MTMLHIQRAVLHHPNYYEAPGLICNTNASMNLLVEIQITATLYTWTEHFEYKIPINYDVSFRACVCVCARIRIPINHIIMWHTIN